MAAIQIAVAEPMARHIGQRRAGCCDLPRRRRVRTDAAISALATCSSVKAGEIEYTEKFVSTFFELRIYKKGTVHLKFRDKPVWEKFNGRVAQIRKWIAPAEEEDDDNPPWEAEEEEQDRIEQLGLIPV